MDLSRRYRLASAAAVRPESFGGLIYHHGRRSLYRVQGQALVDLLRALDGSCALGATLDELVAAGRVPEGGRAALLTALAQLRRLELLDEL